MKGHIIAPTNDISSEPKTIMAKPIRFASSIFPAPSAFPTIIEAVTLKAMAGMNNMLSRRMPVVIPARAVTLFGKDAMTVNKVK